MVVIKIESEADFDNAIKSGVVVVDFFATWCGPCKMISPKIESMSEKHTGAKFLKVDVDIVPDLSEREEVDAMPTFKIYKDGKCVETIVGANADRVEEAVEKLLK